jgi:hypothetical protein
MENMLDSGRQNRVWKIALISQLALNQKFSGQQSEDTGRVIYVDGDLSADCVSADYSPSVRECIGGSSFAFQTLQGAADFVTLGDTVQIREGEYLERIAISTSGTETDRITFESYPGESAVIDGSFVVPDPGNPDITSTLFLVNANYITVRNLEITEQIILLCC